MEVVSEVPQLLAESNRIPSAHSAWPVVLVIWVCSILLATKNGMRVSAGRPRDDGRIFGVGAYPSLRWWREGERGADGWNGDGFLAGQCGVETGLDGRISGEDLGREKWRTMAATSSSGSESRFPRDSDRMPQARWHEQWSWNLPIIVAATELSRCSVEPASLRFYCKSNRLETQQNTTNKLCRV